MPPKLSRWAAVGERILWAAALAVLPITSLPWLAQLAGTNSVAAPAMLFIGLLALFWFVPYLLRGGGLPRQVVPFLCLVLVAIISSARAFFLPVPPYRDGSILVESLTILVTMGIAAAFYLVTAAWARRLDRLEWILRWINIGGILLVAWSLVQAYIVLFNDSAYPLPLVRFQALLSTRGFFYNRVTGWAFEPSWLAHQMNTLYLPFWLAATVQGYSTFRLRIWRFTVENFLLVAGIFILYFSFSRVGWLSFFLVAGFLSLGWVIKITTRIQHWLLKRLQSRFSKQIRQRFLSLGVTAVLAVLVLGLFTGSGFLMIQVGGKMDYRLEDIFDRLADASSFYDLTNRLYIAERVIYWETGWKVFNDYPWLGVGLGNAGFYFMEKMPPFGWKLVELRDTLLRLDFVPNTKSLWTRLLAETGIVGFGLFAVWLYVLWQSGRLSQHSSHPAVRAASRGGQLVILAFLIEGFSVDTFGLPYLWVALGVLTAAASIFQSGKKI